MRVIQHSAHNLFARRIAKRMDDPVVAVTSFAAERQFAFLKIEARPPIDQFVDPMRRFTHDHFDDFAVTQISTRGERVSDVVLEAVFGVHDTSDAALGILAIGVEEVVFGDDQCRKSTVHANRGAKPC